MARKPRHESDEQTPESSIYQSTSPANQFPTLHEDVPLINQAPMLGDATERDRRAADIPPPKRYQVQGHRPIMVMNRGLRVTMQPGKIVDSANYDVAQIRSQGVQLQELPPEPRPAEQSTQPEG